MPRSVAACSLTRSDCSRTFASMSERVQAWVICSAVLLVGCSEAAPERSVGVPEVAADNVGTASSNDVDPKELAETEAQLVTRFQLSDTHVVEFYEPSPGSVYVSEAGLAGEQPASIGKALGEGKCPSVAELYGVLAGESSELPASLAALDERHQGRSSASTAV